MTPSMRTATVNDMGLILDWAAAEGWNPGLDDAATFHAADPDGFFVAEDETGLVAAISVVNHSYSFAFLGLYLCRPDRRGRGIGLALWQHALAHAGDRIVGLDGVAAQQGNYARSGFALVGSTTRLVGPVAEPVGDAPRLRAATPADIAPLAALDAEANGVDRPRFITAWLTQTGSRRTVVMDGPDGPVGFATARLCRTDCKVGPVVAPDASAARDLAHTAARSIGATRCIIDLPSGTEPLRSLLETEGFSETFATARMYRTGQGGEAPTASPRLFATATLELG